MLCVYLVRGQKTVSRNRFQTLTQTLAPVTQHDIQSAARQNLGLRANNVGVLNSSPGRQLERIESEALSKILAFMNE